MNSGGNKSYQSSSDLRCTNTLYDPSPGLPSWTMFAIKSYLERTLSSSLADVGNGI